MVPIESEAMENFVNLKTLVTFKFKFEICQDFFSQMMRVKPFVKGVRSDPENRHEP